MTESTATATYTEIRDAVAKWLFQGTTYSNLSAADKTTEDEIISRGFRLYLAPPILPGERQAHTWSWIRPETTINVVKDPSGTTTTALTTDSVVIDSAATFTTIWATVGANELIGKTITVVVDGTSITNNITAVNSATQVTVGTAWTSAQVTGSSTSDTYSIAADGDYNLPDDHGGIIGTLTFDNTTHFPPVKQTSEARIRNLRQASLIDQTRRPHLFALRTRQSTVTTTGGNSELMLWPRPDASYTFHYRYVKLFDEASSGSDIFPGGLRNSECAMAACIAVAERFSDPTTPASGKQWDYFIEVLRTAVSLDRQEMGAGNLGPNLDHSDSRSLSIHDHSAAPTYLGVTYPT